MRIQTKSALFAERLEETKIFLKENAEHFLNAFHILRESNDALINKLSNPPVSTSEVKAFGTLPTMGVDIVCLAFSVELYIKDLHYAITQKAPRGHNILTLFRKLPERAQQQIFKYPSVSKYGWSFSEFEREIAAVSDGFEKWRYSHESRAIRYNIYFALVFIEAVKFVAASELNRS